VSQEGKGGGKTAQDAHVGKPRQGGEEPQHRGDLEDIRKRGGVRGGQREECECIHNKRH